MTSVSARIEHPDGSTETVDATQTQETYEFEKIDIASIWLTRSTANGVTLNEEEDEVYIEGASGDEFGGILRDVLRGGSEVELVVESFERLAMDAERSGSGERWEAAADDAIVNDALGRVPDLSANTVDQLNPQTTFVFSHASPAKQIRTVAEALGGEVFYHPDKTVSYVDGLGTDQTGTTISPSNQNISGSLKPKREGGDRRVTHLVILGAHEGDAQIKATIVPQGDSQNFEASGDYENVRRYNATTWADGDRRVWDARINKDVSDVSTLQDQGVELVQEFEQESIDVEVTVEDNDVALGDEFTIAHPDEGVNRTLRAVEVDRVIDNDGLRYECVFSNRRLTRQTDSEKEAKDIERYNMAFEGESYGIDAGGSRQPVSDRINYMTKVYYPGEVNYEHRLNLRVIGHPYRAYSAGGESGGLHQHLVGLSVTTPGAAADAASTNPALSFQTTIGFTGSTSQSWNYPSVGESAP